MEHADRMTTDQLIVGATEQAATNAEEPKEKHHVEPALFRALALAGVQAKCFKIPVPQWAPSAGPTDIVVGRSEPYDAIIEVKVNDLGWCLWDMVKVASILDGGKARDGYLIVGGTKKMFATPGHFAGMLDTRSSVSTEKLFYRYPKDWLDLLRGGNGRPVKLPARIDLERLVTVDFTHAPTWELRAIKVSVPPDSGYVQFVSESWPKGHPRLPKEIQARFDDPA